jgi:hypothetical protein
MDVEAPAPLASDPDAAPGEAPSVAADELRTRPLEVRYTPELSPETRKRLEEREARRATERPETPRP